MTMPTLPGVAYYVPMPQYLSLCDETLKLTLQGKNISHTYNCEILKEKNSCLYYSLSEFNNIKSKKNLYRFYT